MGHYYRHKLTHDLSDDAVPVSGSNYGADQFLFSNADIVTGLQKSLGQTANGTADDTLKTGLKTMLQQKVPGYQPSAGADFSVGDVRALQTLLLKSNAYPPGSAASEVDGKFGARSQQALIKMLQDQKMMPAPAAQAADAQRAAPPSAVVTQSPKINPGPYQAPAQPVVGDNSGILVFHQSEGTLTTPDGKVIVSELASGRNISGFNGRNNPSLQFVKLTGTIPQGTWRIGPELPFHGRQAFALTPLSGTNTHGRNGFFMHIEFAKMHGQTHGCVGFPNQGKFSIVENLARQHKLKTLQVVA